MERDLMPPMLRYILEEAKRPRSKQEVEAERKLVFGIGSIADVSAAKQAARRQLERRER